MPIVKYPLGWLACKVWFYRFATFSIIAFQRLRQVWQTVERDDGGFAGTPRGENLVQRENGYALALKRAHPVIWPPADFASLHHGICLELLRSFREPLTFFRNILHLEEGFVDATGFSGIETETR